MKNNKLDCNSLDNKNHSNVLNNSAINKNLSSIYGCCEICRYDNKNYFLTIVEDFSRSTWTYLIKTKVMAYECFLSFINMVKFFLLVSSVMVESSPSQNSEIFLII